MPNEVDAASVLLMAEHLGKVAAALMEMNLLTATIGTDVPYAPDVLYGTRPHDILPRNKQALFWPGARHPVAMVHHPGYKGNDFLTAASDRGMPLLAEEVGFALGAAVEGGNPARVIAAFRAGIADIEADVKAHANVRTGRLRDSFTTRYSR
jgi:hypothetical protein